MTALPRKVSTGDMDDGFRICFRSLLTNLASGMTKEGALAKHCVCLQDLLIAEQIANRALGDMNAASQKA